jgi:hypothetical protein
VLVEAKSAGGVCALRVALEEFATAHVLVLVDFARREAPIKNPPGLVVAARSKLMTRSMVIRPMVVGTRVTGAVMREGAVAVSVATVGGGESKEHQTQEQQEQQQKEEGPETETWTGTAEATESHDVHGDQLSLGTSVPPYPRWGRFPMGVNPEIAVHDTVASAEKPSSS